MRACTGSRKIGHGRRFAPWGCSETGRDRQGDAGFTLFTPLRQSLALRHQDQVQTVQVSLRPWGAGRG